MRTSGSLATAGLALAAGWGAAQADRRAEPAPTPEDVIINVVREASPAFEFQVRLGEVAG